jgi:hypothetical protein
MNLVMVKRKATASWENLGVPVVEQLRMRGDAFKFCAKQILAASPIDSRLANVRLPPAHLYTHRDWADGTRPSALFFISGMTVHIENASSGRSHE